MSGGISVTKDGIRKSLAGMMSRAKTVSAFMQRHTLRQYQAAQIQRWQTENASEGHPWEPISAPYKSYKLRRYASYYGSGNALMVATGGTYEAATQAGKGMYKLISDTQFIVGIDLGAQNRDGASLKYAAYAAEKRPIMEFSASTTGEWKDDIAAYITRGKER